MASPLLPPAPDVRVKVEGPRLAAVEYGVRPGREVIASEGNAIPPRPESRGGRELGVVGRLAGTGSWLEVRSPSEGERHLAACRYVTTDAASGAPIPLDLWVPETLQKQLRTIVARALTEPGAVDHRLTPRELQGILRFSYALRSEHGRAHIALLLPPSDRSRRSGYLRLTLRLPPDVVLPRVATRPLAATAGGRRDVLEMPARAKAGRAFSWEDQRALPPHVLETLRQVPPLHPRVTRSLQTTQTLQQALHRLTPTELELAAGVVTGASNVELARAAGVTQEAVSGVLSRAFFKLGVSDRLALGRLLIGARRLHPGSPPDTAPRDDWRHQGVRRLNAGDTPAQIAADLDMPLPNFRYHLKRFQDAWGARSLDHLQLMAMADDGEVAPGQLPRPGMEALLSEESKALEQLALGRPESASKTSVIRSALDRLGLDEPWQAAALLVRSGRHPTSASAGLALKSLHPVDLQLVRLLVAGWGRGEMAASLGLGPQVLDERLALLCAGLECQNPLQLTCGALRAGLLPPAPDSSSVDPSHRAPSQASSWDEALWRLHRAERQLVDEARPGGTAASARRRLGWSVAHFSDVLTQLRYKLRLPSFEALIQQASALDAPVAWPHGGKLEPREVQVLQRLAAGEVILTADEASYNALKHLFHKVERAEPYQLVARALEEGVLPWPSVSWEENAHDAWAALPAMAQDLFRGMAAGESLDRVAARWQLSVRELRAQLLPARFADAGSPFTGWLHQVGLLTEAQVPVFVRALGAHALTP